MKNTLNKVLKKNADVLRYSAKAILYLRQQNYYAGLHCITESLSILNNLTLEFKKLEDYFNGSNISINIDFNYFNQVLLELTQAQLDKDFILLADLYELKLNRFILDIQSLIMENVDITYDEIQYRSILDIINSNNAKLLEKKNENTSICEIMDKGYSIEYTSCGLVTLAKNESNSKYYFHSNGNVYQEAYDIVKEWYIEDKMEYKILGLGLGYHILELMEMDESIKITVYESDINIINLACAYGCLKQVLNKDRVSIIYDPDYSQISKAIKNISNDTGYYIHYPSLKNIKNQKIKEVMDDYFLSYSTIKNQSHQLNHNFKKNILRYDYYIDRLREKFQNKDLFIVAAGPSLDKNYKLLKQINNNGIILSTGTVFKKLLKSGILPNYVIIIDGNDGVYKQVEELDVDIPILFLSTVNHKVTNFYKGKKYLICQEGYPYAEEYAMNHGYNLFKTGGSVSTTALDIGIQLGCKRIIFLGLDLAYTNNLNHASDTLEYDDVGVTECRMVEDINGNQIKTGKNLDIYRKWIEKRISQIDDIEFINATEGGAKIKGMKHQSLEEVLNI